MLLKISVKTIDYPTSLFLLSETLNATLDTIHWRTFCTNYSDILLFLGMRAMVRRVFFFYMLFPWQICFMAEDHGALKSGHGPLRAIQLTSV